MAGFIKAIREDIVSKGETGILTATAHVIKFSSFQEMYLTNRFPPEFGVRPKKEFKNIPFSIKPEGLRKLPQDGKPIQREELDLFVKETAGSIARILNLKKK